MGKREHTPRSEESSNVDFTPKQTMKRTTNNMEQQEPSMLDLDTLKAQSPRENSLAKLKIQKVLFETEQCMETRKIVEIKKI